MNTAVYLFTLTGFMVLKAMMIPGATIGFLGANDDFSPRFDTIPISFGVNDIVNGITSVPDCNNFLLCLNVPFTIVANFLIGLFKIIVDLVEIILNIIAFILEVILFVGVLVFTRIPGAPIYVNILLIGIPAIMLGLAIINAFKPGAKAD